jgi:hypothetical protein
MKNVAILVTALFIVSACTTAPTQRPTPIPKTSPTKTIPTSTPLPQLLTVTVVLPSLNVRSGPGRDFQIVGYVNQGDEFYVLGKYYDLYAQQWFIISPKNNSFGWIDGESKFVTQKMVTVDSTAYESILNNVEQARVIYSPLGIFQDVIQTSSSLSQAATAVQRPFPLVATSPNLSSIIECKDTKDKIGRFVTCKIERAYCTFAPDVNGDPTFCNDAPYPNHNFTLLVFGQDWSDYDGQCVIISGTVGSYQGKPQIYTENRARISYCD